MHKGLPLLASLLMAATSLHAAGETRRTYLAPFESKGDTCVAIATADNTLSQALEVRASLPKVREREKAHDAYGFRWHAGMSDTIVEVSLAPVLTGENTAMESPAIEFKAISRCGDKTTTLIHKILTSKIGFGKETRSLAVEADRTRGVRIEAGKNDLSQIGTLMPEYADIQQPEFFAIGSAKVDDLIYEYTEDPSASLQTKWTKESLTEYFEEHPSVTEGFWRYFDRDTDDGYSRLGGEYILATVSDGRGGLDIIYISGATTLGYRWHEGMRKGRLKPTIFIQNYDLDWRDSKMNSTGPECHGLIEKDGSLLTVKFPLLKSTLRFARIMPSSLTDK